MDPYLRWFNKNPAAFIDFFVNDFLGMAQGPAHWRRRRVQRTLFHSLYKEFWPCDSGYSSNRQEVLLLKKIRARDCTWSTYQFLLGLVIDTVKMIQFLP